MVVLLAVTIAGVWNGTSTPVILSAAPIEASIKRTLLTQRHLSSTVSCPDDVIQKAGVTFYCYATVKDRRYPVMVTETNNLGHVTYVVQ